MVDPAIRQALTWATLGLSVILTVFTWADVSAGYSSTALWISAFAWPLVAIISGWILRKNPYRSPDRQD